jgi:hypothetical protein
MVQLLLVLGERVGTIDVQVVVLLGPLAGQNGSWERVSNVSTTRRSVMLTLQELLASILLEEGFVGDRAVQVVNHQLEDRLNLLLGVSRVVSKSSILRRG